MNLHLDPMNEIEILNLAKEPSHALSLQQPTIPIDSDKAKGRCPQNSRLNQKSNQSDTT